MSILTDINKLDTIVKFNLPMNPLSCSLELPTYMQSLNEICMSFQLYNRKYEDLQATSYNNWYNACYNCNESMGSCTNICGITEDNSSYVSERDMTKHSIIAINLCETEDTNVITLSKSESEAKIVDCDIDDLEDDWGQVPKKWVLLDKYPHETVRKYDRKLGKSVKVFKCKYEGCTKEFNKSWNLVYHARVHTSEKPFKCTECRECFAQKGNLKRHMKIHSNSALGGRKRLQCEICLKKYTTKFNLKVHQQTKHQNMD